MTRGQVLKTGSIFSIDPTYLTLANSIPRSFIIFAASKHLDGFLLLKHSQPMRELVNKTYFETLLNIQFVILNNQIFISLNEILNSYITRLTFFH